ncbi:hypothetical protein ACX1N5_03955 [Acinetobacter sp. ANC 4636]
MDIKKKQATWNQERPLFEAKYWLPDHFSFLNFDMKQGNYVIKEDLDPIYEDDATEIYHRVNTGWAMWKKCTSSMKAEIDDLKAKLEKVQAIKQTYFLRDADYVVDHPCEYELKPELGEVFEFEKWNRTKEVKVYIVQIFKNEDEYELVEFSSEDEADKAAAENKAMIEVTQGEEQ